MLKRITAAIGMSFIIASSCQAQSIYTSSPCSNQACKSVQLPTRQVCLHEDYSVEEFCESLNNNLKSFKVTHTNLLTCNNTESYLITFNNDSTNVMMIAFADGNLNQIVMVDPDETRLKEKLSAALKVFNITQDVHEQAKVQDIFIYSKSMERFYIVKYDKKEFPAYIIYAGK